MAKMSKASTIPRKKDTVHPNEKAFREKAKTDPKYAEHLKKFPEPVKLSKKRSVRMGDQMSRPEKPLDWAKVDQLLMAGCKGTQIAPHFDMHPETFYDKVKEKYGIGFTEYCAIKREHGDSLLHAKQFEKALKGDNAMLIWLGKQRLGQREQREDPNQHQKLVFEVNYKNDVDNPLEILPKDISENGSSQA